MEWESSRYDARLAPTSFLAVDQNLRFETVRTAFEQ